jgi:hypothetical protein
MAVRIHFSSLPWTGGKPFLGGGCFVFGGRGFVLGEEVRFGGRIFSDSRGLRRREDNVKDVVMGLGKSLQRRVESSENMQKSKSGSSEKGSADRGRRQEGNRQN